MATKTKTRTRQTAGSTKAKTQAKEKTDAQKQKAAEAAARAEKREAAQAAKEKARKDAIEQGTLIVNGEVEYHLVTKDANGKLESRANDVLKALKASKTPLRKQEIAGADITSTGMFAMLKALGLVTEYRARSGERGGSGVAYMWVD